MKVRKSVLWSVVALIVIVVGGFVAYKAFSPTKSVDLATFNTKEDQLTQEAVQIHNEIQNNYDQLEKGTLKPTDFKKNMVPLYDEMKKNWDQYTQFTKSNSLSQNDRNSKEFKQGVVLASNIRLDEYTFLINVTQYNLTKPQIEAKYKDTLAQFDAKLKQYEDATKDLQRTTN